MPDVSLDRNAAARRSFADRAAAEATFFFVPDDLIIRCSTMVERYHDLRGYACLPDMLWHANARDLINRHRELAGVFKRASRSRSARRTNDLLLFFATMIVSLEVLAQDLGGWGKEFPVAKREAEKLLGGLPLKRPVWLIDAYSRSLLTSIRSYLNYPGARYR